MNKNSQVNLFELKELCLRYSTSQEFTFIIDSNDFNEFCGNFKYLAAFGCRKLITDLEMLTAQYEQNSWALGILSYSLRTAFELLPRNNNPVFEMPDVAFFEPEILLAVTHSGEYIDFFKNGSVVFSGQPPLPSVQSPVFAQSQVSQDEYLQNICKIKEMICAGEVYELNYCIPYFADIDDFNAELFYQNLAKLSPSPMGSFFKWQGLFVCGASMERFIKKTGDKIISQPIKGTAKRLKDVTQDAIQKQTLLLSEKERAENVMIVDLVRNDLNRFCKTGTVKVDELFGIYSFSQVHQMISTVSGILKEDVSFHSILQSLFPMGSMTGAPKIAAMKIIDQIETFERAWYSGSLGYLAPGGDFDFNVIIRSVIGDSNTKRLSYFAGGAITIDSSPEQEWDEIQSKVSGIESVLNQGMNFIGTKG